MVLSDEKKREYMKKLLLSRMRILCNNGFYGLLLMHMTYSIDESCKSAATNGKRIFFSPDFQIIFEYVRQHMQSKLPASIIILTDGYAPFPREKMAMGIPVLWLLNNEDVNSSWGKVARIRL